LLYAPNSGKKTRRLIKDKAAEFVDAVKEKTSGVIDTVKDAAGEARQRGGDRNTKELKVVLVSAIFRVSDGCWWHYRHNCLIEKTDR